MGCHFSKNSLLPARLTRTRISHISKFSDSDLEEHDVYELSRIEKRDNTPNEVEKPVQTTPSQDEKPSTPNKVEKPIDETAPNQVKKPPTPNQDEKPEPPKAGNETANSGVHQVIISEEEMRGSTIGTNGIGGDGNKENPESPKHGKDNANSGARNADQEENKIIIIDDDDDTDDGESSSPGTNKNGTDEKPEASVENSEESVEKPETNTLVEVTTYTNYVDQDYVKQIRFSNGVMGQNERMYMFSEDNPNACYIM